MLCYYNLKLFSFKKIKYQLRGRARVQKKKKNYGSL